MKWFSVLSTAACCCLTLSGAAAAACDDRFPSTCQVSTPKVVPKAQAATQLATRAKSVRRYKRHKPSFVGRVPDTSTEPSPAWFARATPDIPLPRPAPEPFDDAAAELKPSLMIDDAFNLVAATDPDPTLERALVARRARMLAAPAESHQ
jgi:hypothetical protein